LLTLTCDICKREYKCTGYCTKIGKPVNGSIVRHVRRLLIINKINPCKLCHSCFHDVFSKETNPTIINLCAEHMKACLGEEQLKELVSLML